MHDLMSQRKSGFLLGLCILVTIYIGWHFLLPIMIIYIPISYTHVGIPVPDSGRKGYVRSEYDVSFSANGRLVAFTTNGNSLKHYDERSNKGLFLYSAQSGKTHQISTGLWHPSISIEKPKITRNGSHILFFAANKSDPTILYPTVRLYLYDVTTQETKQIVLPEEVHMSLESNFQISPNGRYLGGVVSEGIIFIYDQTTGSYTTFTGAQLYVTAFDYEIQRFHFLPDQQMLFAAKSGSKDLYGIYSLESNSYGVIDRSIYDNLQGNHTTPIPNDLLSLARKDRNKFYGFSSDENTAVFLLGENRQASGDFNLTYDLYWLDRQSGNLNRIPTPNWKRSTIIILTAVNTLLAGYILFTDSGNKRPFPTP